MAERIKAIVPVFLFLTRNNTVYLQRRHNTGYLDGGYEPIAGKIDGGESPQAAVCREAREEARVIVSDTDLDFFHAYLNNDNPHQPWLGLMFRTSNWEGEPTIGEPGKCDHAGWFPIDNPPERIIPYVRDALAQIASSVTIQLDYYPPGSIRPEM